MQWRVAVEDVETRVLYEPATSQSAGALFVCAHGAGSDMDHRTVLALSRVLRARGLDVMRFNFLYREKGSRRPDAMPRLKACMAAVVGRARAETAAGKKLVIGGRSMGGRVASMLAAEGFACDGLLMLAYPLHPAGQPEKLRAAHLPQIRVPVLCINGTRDALCERALMDRAIAGLAWRMHWLEGKDHSFAVDDRVAALVESWLPEL